MRAAVSICIWQSTHLSSSFSWSNTMSQAKSWCKWRQAVLLDSELPTGDDSAKPIVLWGQLEAESSKYLEGHNFSMRIMGWRAQIPCTDAVFRVKQWDFYLSQLLLIYHPLEISSSIALLISRAVQKYFLICTKHAQNSFLFFCLIICFHSRAVVTAVPKKDNMKNSVRWQHFKLTQVFGNKHLLKVQ